MEPTPPSVGKPAARATPEPPGCTEHMAEQRCKGPALPSFTLKKNLCKKHYLLRSYVHCSTCSSVAWCFFLPPGDTGVSLNVELGSLTSVMCCVCVRPPVAVETGQRLTVGGFLKKVICTRQLFSNNWDLF